MPTIKAKVDGNWVTMGGVGPGVKPGGTTNQILSKASAADYDTQWTSAPVLTGLTSSGHITLANNVNLRALDTGGTPQNLLFLGGNNTAYIASDLVAGRTIQIGGSGAAISISGDATVTGTLTSKHAARAAAYVNGSAGTFHSQFGFTAVTRVSSGIYNLTFPGVAYPIPVATGADNLKATSSVISGTQVSVNLHSTAGAAVDGNFSIVIFSP